MNATQTVKAAADTLDTAMLIASLRLLNKQNVTDDERFIRAVICGVLEDRNPEAVERMDAWAELAWGQELSYGEALIVVLTEMGVTS